jgi:hypothetical protein
LKITLTILGQGYFLSVNGELYNQEVLTIALFSGRKAIAVRYLSLGEILKCQHGLIKVDDVSKR